MKKALLILLVGLFWCSVGFAKNIDWNDMKNLYQTGELSTGITDSVNIVLSSKNKEFKNSDLGKRFLNYVNSYLDKRDECYQLSVMPKDIYKKKITRSTALKNLECLYSYDRMLIQSNGLELLENIIEYRYILQINKTI